MPRFPLIEQLTLPCRFGQYVLGQLHTDGRRYLPLLVLELPVSGAVAPDVMTSLAVVDRHHVVDPALEGYAGDAKLVFLLSRLKLQSAPTQRGLVADPALPAGRAITSPIAYGQVVAVPSWEIEHQHLPYQELFGEILLDVGIGVIGVRTSTTAADLCESIGARRIEPGDWVQVWRSRIDILAFEAVSQQ